MANPKYVRKRIDFNLFDDIGHGHKIHAAAFNIYPELNRHPSSGTNDTSKDLDVVSTTGSEVSALSTLGRRRSSSFGKGAVRNSNYMSLSKARASASVMKFPSIPSAFPKVPTKVSFPVAPESPTLSTISDVPSELSQNDVTLYKVSMF